MGVGRKAGGFTGGERLSGGGAVGWLAAWGWEEGLCGENGGGVVWVWGGRPEALQVGGLSSGGAVGQLAEWGCVEGLCEENDGGVVWVWGGKPEALQVGGLSSGGAVGQLAGWGWEEGLCGEIGGWYGWKVRALQAGRSCPAGAIGRAARPRRPR